MTYVMKTIRTTLRKLCSHYRKDITAAIVVMFAVMAPVLVGASGMALDYARAYLVKQRLAQAIDAAALAAAAISSDPATIEQKVQDFFDVNYPPEKLGATFDPQVVVDGDIVSVTGNAYYTTLFLHLIGIEDIAVDAYTEVQREVQGIEVVLVLDNTGSMGYNNNIGTLRTATCEFVEILFGTFDDSRNDDCLERFGSFVEPVNEFVKIGIVPYSGSVNVSSYGLGYDEDGGIYDTAFLNNPADLSFSNDGDTDLCITESYGTDTTDHEGPWNMYRWCRRLSDEYPVCDYRTDRWGNRSPRRDANYRCPRASILPLTRDMRDLKNRASEMIADGTTSGNIGMVWGWRVLSPEYPFQEGVDWDNKAYRKVVVMMTDGNNVFSSPYSAYGTEDTHPVRRDSHLDDRLAATCDNMQDEDNVTIYTVTFEDQDGSIDSATRELYEDCAANGGSHTHVRSAAELRNVFRDIAQELSNLRIRS